MTFCGIDYGSKLAGTTVITYLHNGIIVFQQSQKGQDADVWLKKMLEENRFSYGFIDAPLSLPGGFFEKGENFHYRQADKLLNAMSPMFLGGLTARAIQLKSELSNIKINFLEVYPGGWVRQEPMIYSYYNKKDLKTIPIFNEELKKILPFPLGKTPENYHQMDSIICWYIGWKHQNSLACAYGNKEEGLIWI